MEKQRISVLKQKNRWGVAALFIGLCVLLAPALGAVLFLPQVLTMIPVVLLALLGYAGPAVAVGCCVVMVGTNALLYGVWGGVAVFLLIVPAVLAAVISMELDQPFWHCVAAGSVTMFASMGAVVAMLSVLAGSDVVTALSDIVAQAFSAQNGVFGDVMLTVMMQMGMVAVPEGVELGTGIVTLDAAVREELVSSLVMMMDAVMRLEIPMQMATGSVAAGLLGQAALRKGLLRRGEKVAYPKLRTWRIPSGWGRILGGTLAALYLLSMLVPASMNTMFYVFSGVFDQLFALQGIAAVCYMLHKHGKSSRWQAVVFILGYFFLRTPAMILGIGDQAMDIAHRREELDKLENPFDPRRGE